MGALVPGSYRNASLALLADFEDVIGTCAFSLEGMAYREVPWGPALHGHEQSGELPAPA